MSRRIARLAAPPARQVWYLWCLKQRDFFQRVGVVSAPLEATRAELILEHISRLSSNQGAAELRTYRQLLSVRPPAAALKEKAPAAYRSAEQHYVTAQTSLQNLARQAGTK